MLQYSKLGLNAPSGAGCFLTRPGRCQRPPLPGLNAPSGAGCFLTAHFFLRGGENVQVLMHLLVLGAF